MHEAICAPLAAMSAPPVSVWREEGRERYYVGVARGRKEAGKKTQAGVQDFPWSRNECCAFIEYEQISIKSCDISHSVKYRSITNSLGAFRASQPAFYHPLINYIKFAAAAAKPVPTTIHISILSA